MNDGLLVLPQLLRDIEKLCLHTFNPLLHLLALTLSYPPQLLRPCQLVLISRLLLSKPVIIFNELIKDPFELLPPGSPLSYLLAHGPYLGLPLGDALLLLLHLPAQTAVVRGVRVDDGLLVLGLPVEVVQHRLVPLRLSLVRGFQVHAPVHALTE